MLLSCSDTTTGTGGPPTCVPGKVEACPCPAGAQGIQTCLADGTWDACQCGGATETPDVGTTDTVAPDSADGADATPDIASEPEVDAPGPDPDTVSVSDAPTSDVLPSDHCDPCGYGEVKGVVCAPSQQVYVPNATVTITAIDCDGEAKTWTTQSDVDGTYYFPEIPCGLHTVDVVAGQFHKTYSVQVKSDQLNDHSGAAFKLCFAAGSIPIAVWWGQWDHQHDLLGEIGLDYTFYNYKPDVDAEVPPDAIEALQVLRDPDALAAYKILFFNCASKPLDWVQDYPEIGDNLRDFVLAGGSIYASDLAWAYVEAAFPDAIDFYGTKDLPYGAQANDGPQQVEGQSYYPATVEDSVMAAYIGTTVFETFYGPGPLIGIDAAHPDGTVHVKGIVKVPAPDPPVCGDGVCQGAELLTCTSDCAGKLPTDVVDHGGPMVVSYQPNAMSGRVIYTTFHNDEQADELMKKILYYLIFLL